MSTLDELFKIREWTETCGCHCCNALDKKVVALINQLGKGLAS